MNWMRCYATTLRATMASTEKVHQVLCAESLRGPTERSSLPAHWLPGGTLTPPPPSWMSRVWSNSMLIGWWRHGQVCEIMCFCFFYASSMSYVSCNLLPNMFDGADHHASSGKKFLRIGEPQ